MHDLLLATLRWDPQIRGFLILATGVLILPGSVFFLLSTNIGAKIGVIVTAAGLSGWIFALSFIWILYGTGMKGNPPSWQVKEIVIGDLTAHAATGAVQTFPGGWAFVPKDSPALAPAQSAADRLLTPPPAPAEGKAPTVPKFAPPFKTTQDYVPIAAYTKGGDNYLFRIGSYKVKMTWKHHEFFLKHQPHYFIVRVQPALPAITLAGAATTLPAPDPTKPVVSVVMVRDVGSLRLPNVLICLSAFLVFAVCCSFLHRRDKEIMRHRALVPVSG